MSGGVGTPSAPAAPSPSHGPLIFALVILAVTGAASLRAALLLTGGHLVYAVDDAYIHMSMARTLAESGVWGISAARPAFASSSPGWTVLLTVLYAAGLRGEWVPLAVNAVAAVALVLIADRAARRLLVTERARLWLLLAVVLVTPAPALILAGMETLWQVASVVGFVSVAARVVAWRDRAPAPRDRWVMLACAPVMVSLRYESLFVAAAVVLLLAWRRRLWLAVALTAASFIPVAVYAAFAVSHGGWWLPASVMLKGQPPSLGRLYGFISFMSDKGLPALFTHWPLPPVLIALLLCAIVLTWRDAALEGEAEGWLLIGALAILIHVHLVNIEWLFRYRAYLVVTGVMATAFGISRVRQVLGVSAAALRQPRPRYVLLLLLGASLAGPPTVLAVDALSRGPRGCLSIYLQQYQMARFLASQGGRAVALNDIGAVSYFTKRPIVDLAGLADQRIAVSRRAAEFDTTGIERAASAAGADVAVIYESWFEGRLAPPPAWVRVARWTAAEHVTTASETVSFFATTPESAARLRRALRAWTPQLPAGVSVAIDESPGVTEP